MKLLLTAFDPFGGASVNPAWEAVSRVRDRIGEIEITKLMVPTVFSKSSTLANRTAREIGADAVICVGQAGGQFGFAFERVAINLEDAPIPDNEGNQPQDTPVDPAGPPAYFTSLPVKKMADAVRAAGLPAKVSYSAGTYVCNHLFYAVMREIDLHFPGRKGGFIHVPFLPEQTVYRANTPSMSLADIVRGLETAIAALSGCE